MIRRNRAAPPVCPNKMYWDSNKHACNNNNNSVTWSWRSNTSQALTESSPWPSACTWCKFSKDRYPNKRANTVWTMILHSLLLFHWGKHTWEMIAEWWCCGVVLLCCLAAIVSWCEFKATDHNSLLLALPRYRFSNTWPEVIGSVSYKKGISQISNSTYGSWEHTQESLKHLTNFVQLLRDMNGRCDFVGGDTGITSRSTDNDRVTIQLS